MKDNEHLLPNPNPDFVSEDWHFWYRKLCQELDIRADIPLAGQSLPQPWFLIPKQNELSEEQAVDLLGTVQQFLLEGKSGSLTAVKNRLLRLQGNSVLPFLYTMRYVAFREAGRRYYWPAFTNLILDDRFEPNLVAITLASTTSTVWLRLYEATRGALYYPREGLRHIKWPIAHAGLLPEDKEILREFGLTLLEGSTELYYKVCGQEIGEFILEFRDWLDNNQEYTYSRFGNLMGSTRGDREVIAELGQQWLRLHHQELEGQHQVYPAKWEFVPSTSRRLIYDPHRNQLGLSVSLSRIPGTQMATLEWDDQKIDFQSQYDPNTRERIMLDQFLSLEGPNWSDKATLFIGSKSYQLNIPTLDRNKSVVFEPSSGVQIKRWEFGQEYILLIPGKLFKPATASTLFAAWSEVGTPRGDWQDFTLIWVRTQDPFSLGGLREPSEIVHQLATLEQSVEEMGLPSFGHQYRVRMLLVGGEQIDLAADHIPVFSTTRPPYLEIRGIWNEKLTLTLLRREKTSGEYTTVSTLEIDQEWSRGSCIVELWENYAQENRYRLLLNQHQLDFIVARKETGETRPNVSRLDIEAFFEDVDGHRIVNPSRYDLENLVLHVRSWPQADLMVDISIGETERFFPLQTDENGHWTEHTENIPFDFSTPVSSPILLDIGWRGVFSQQLLLSDIEHVKLDDFKVVTTENALEHGFTIHCQGIVRGKAIPRILRGSLLADPPWHDVPYEFDIQVSQTGDFECVVTTNWCPSWIVVAREETSIPNSNPLISVRRTDTPRDYPSQTQFIGPQNPIFQFADIAETIAEISHPPELDIYLATVPAIKYLREAFDVFQSSQTWQFISEWGDLLLKREHLGSEKVISLFGGEVDEDHIVENVVDDLVFDFSKTTQKRFLFFRFRSQNTFSGRLMKSPLPRDQRIILESFDTLWRCPTCNLILPTRFQFDHLNAHAAGGETVELRAKPEDFNTGAKLTGISIGITTPKGNSFRKIREQLQQVLNREKDFEPGLVDWLRSFSHFVPDQTDRETWLRTVVEVMTNTLALLESGNFHPHDLERISRSLVDSREGFSEILRRAKEIQG